MSTVVKHWLEAMRLRTLPLALSTILTGSALADREQTGFIGILLLATCTTILLQVLSNLANDYGDYQNGADNEGRIGPRRTVEAGLISAASMRKAIIVCAVLSFLSGLGLLWVSFGLRERWTELFVFLGFGILAIAAALTYTAGKNPYGYRGLGDLSVLLFFGLLGVGGTYYLHTGSMSIPAFLPALSIGLFSTAVLNLNNLRDHENDARSGKRTLVVMLGFSGGKLYHSILLATAWVMLLLYLSIYAAHPWMWLATLALPIQIVHLVRVWRTEEAADLDPELKKVALSTFLIGLLLFIGGI